MERGETLPTGTVTFLMTDVEGSTRLHAEKPEATLAALKIHDRVGAESIALHNGVLIKSKGEGDSLFAVFEDPVDAINGILAFQLNLETAPWPEGAKLRVRAAVHTGEAEMDDDDYRGVTVNRCARLRGICHGGQVIMSEVTKSLIEDRLPDLVTLKDMGSHRLKDLLQAEQVYQMVHPDLQEDFPALASLGVRPNNLPVQLNSFVGRDAEIDEITKALKSHRLVTLMGGGGAGKTRLALQIGAENLELFTGGVFFVELAAVNEPELVPHAIAQALNVREEPGVPLIQTVTTWLKEKKILLIIDNCEQVVDGAAKTVSALLKGCSGVTVLATSRQVLHVSGEFEFRVASLSLPPLNEVHTAESLEGYEAVKLLLERAQAKAPNFRLTDQNAEAIAKLCVRLDGIPLCLELAAPKLKLFTPEQLLQRLNDVLKVLSGSSVDEDPRHQTIQATIDWSYQLLSEEERSVLKRLSVYAAGCSYEAAEHACDGLPFDVLEAISQLYDKSMVFLEPTDSGDMRQRQLETVRAFALARLEEDGEADDARERMVDWFIRIAKEANDQFKKKGDEAVLDNLNREHANFGVALEWCLSNASRAAQSLEFSVQLHRYWQRRGHLREGTAWLQTALNAAPNAPAEVRADALNILGVFNWYQGKLDLAKQCIEESLDLWRVLGNDAKVAAATNNLALLAVMEGRQDRARDYLVQAVEVFGKLADIPHQSDALANLGNLEIELGEYDKATEYLERSLSLKRQQGDLWSVAMVLGSLASAHMLAKDLPASTKDLRECLRVVRSTKDETLATSSLLEAAYLVVLNGQIELASRLAGASDAAVERLGIELNPSHVKLRNLVVAAVDDADPGRGYDHFSSKGRTLSCEKALDEAIKFVNSPQRDVSLN